MKDALCLPDFDTLCALAAADPAAFEVRRQEVIDAAIGRASPERQQRLRGLQWRIEQVRSRASSPLSACISLSDMMWEAVAGEEGLLDALRNGPPPNSRDTPSAAVICPLRRPLSS